MKKLIVTVLLLFLSGCAAPSSVGRYGDTPGDASIRGSAVFRVVQFSRDETMEATNKAFLRLGFTPEERNEKLGRITGGGNYKCGGPSASFTMAVYVQQISNKPETKFTIIVDRHSLLDCWGGGTTMAANALASEILKVLSTY